MSECTVLETETSLRYEIVATGLQYPEGPICMADGSVLVVEIRRGTLTRVLPNGVTRVVAEVGGGPNGAAIGPDGCVYICNNGGYNWVDLPDGTAVSTTTPDTYTSGSIQRVDLETGKVMTLYTSGPNGEPLRGPNDIAFDKRGGFWFTDLGRVLDGALCLGALYYAEPDGSLITRANRGMLLTPNGVGLSPDESILYVAETFTGRLWSWNIEAPGVLAPSSDPHLPGYLLTTLQDYRMFDSLAVEANGAICLACLVKGGIVVVNKSGITEQYAVPDDSHVTNICFGGQDMKDAWITSSGKGRLLKSRWPRPGQPIPFVQYGSSTERGGLLS